MAIVHGEKNGEITFESSVLSVSIFRLSRHFYGISKLQATPQVFKIIRKL